ncbi:conserved hypothetical protein [Histoplasma capsulatum H143]|uniref:Uncharacterized protein n=1 Tax=Ajellomyces capsulatus (strain H143) TaxID=544712 RepID=C6H8X3_AJECH|nr:conserved hypothetical protein [Histoplasma capsulatum H143]
MSTQTTQAHKIKESETSSEDSRGGSVSSSATDATETLIILDQEAIMTKRIQQQSSVESLENISLSSTGSTRPTSPVQATYTWELTAHRAVHCEKSTAGEAIHIILSSNPLNLQPSRPIRLQFKKRTMQPTGAAGQENSGK